MEILGAFLDEEWDSMIKMFSGGEDQDSLLHYDSQIPFLANSDRNECLPSDHFNTNFCSFSQESSNTSDQVERAVFPNLCDYNDQQPFMHDQYSVTNNTFESVNYYNMDSSNHGLMMPAFSDDAMEEILRLKGENGAAETGGVSGKEVQLKRKKNDDKSKNHSQDSSPKKIPRVSRNAQKNSRKNKKKIQEENNEGEGDNGGGNRQSSSGCSSDDDSNDSKAKTKASKGSATDPQSIYARKRRERINERLKILQNLVPNGTKVDISTMLEEAVQYVKFLQLQIKLLSSDDLWMYAPLAYNGMDIGFYQNISPNLRIQN